MPGLSAVCSSDEKTARPGSYGSETVTSARPGERLEQRPLGTGQILEPVRVDGPSVPRGEVAGHPLGRMAPLEIAIPEAEPVELLTVGAHQLAELSVDLFGLDEAGLELGDGGAERVGKAGEPCRPAELREARPGDDVAHEQRPLRVGDERPVVPVRAGNPLEHVVERADSAAEQRTGAPSRSRSTRSTSGRFGTIRTGSRSMSAR